MRGNGTNKHLPERTQAHMDFNRHFKRIRISHRMEREDVVKCCALGGLDIAPSRAEGWARGESDTRRHVTMTEAEFDAFTAGLVAWARDVYE